MTVTHSNQTAPVGPSATPSPPEDRDVDDLAQAVDAATSRLADLDSFPRSVAADLVAAHADVHRAGLVHLVRALRADPRGKELLFALVDDPAIKLMLLSHGIIRPDPMTAAAQVLEGVRPSLQSHGGDVSLDRIEGHTAYVRLAGACNGCSMASVTMREGVEAALVAGVPGITSVEVLPNEPGPALIPLSSIGIRPGAGERGWVRAGALSQFDLGTVTPCTLSPDDGPSISAVVVNVAGQLAAYVNACAHQGLPLDDALLDVTAGTLTCSWHGFCYDATSGECLSLPGAQLDPLPLRVDDGHVWVRAQS